MKNNFFWCLLGVLWLGCGQNNPPAAPQPVTVEKPVMPETAPAPAVDSTYLIDDFLTTVAKVRSPYAASKMDDYPLFGFSFTPKRLTGFTVHEGGYDTDLSFNPVTKKYIGKATSGLPAFELSVVADGSIRLTFFKSKKTYTYHKVPDADSALRKVLFEGNYTDVKAKTPVVFKADGTLTGLGEAKTYQPIYDYLGGPLNFDEMIVREKADGSKESYYHYKFKGNTLELYEAIQPQADDVEGLEKIGDLRYTLIKN